MTKFYLNIVFLLGFLFAQSESIAQVSHNSVELDWKTIQSQTESGSIQEVKTSFNAFAKKAIQNNASEILIDKILLIDNYFEKVGEFAEKIFWYQYAIDSLCNNEYIRCVEVRRRFAELYGSIEQYDKAIKLHKDNLLFLKSKQFNDAVSLENSLIARYYHFSKDMRQAEIYYLNSLESAKKANSLFYIILAYNNLGFFYSQNNDFEQSEKYYLQGIKTLESKDSIKAQQKAQLALLKGNLGGNYLLNQEQLEKGILYLNEDIHFNLEQGELDLAMNASIELAKYYYSIKDFQKANETILNCIGHPRIQSREKPNNELLVLNYYWLFKAHLEQQKNTEALHYFKAYDSLKTVRDEAREARRTTIEKSLLENILNVQLNYQNQQIQLKEKENEVLVEKNKLYFYQVTIGLILLLSLLLFLFFYGRKRISLLRIKKELAENKFEVEKIAKEKANIELKYKNKDLTDFAIDISRKQEVLTEVKSKLGAILEGEWKDESIKKAIKSLIFYTNNNLIIDEQLKEFQENVDEINYKFLDTLQKEYPNLTELDKNVCGLIRLGLSNKEIATMRNVSYKAVRMSRYRIRKKLNLPAEVDLVEFLKGIG